MQKFSERINQLLKWVEIDATTGQVLGTFGGDAPEAFTPDSGHFTYQHDPNWTEDGTILLVSTFPREDNGRDETIAIEYEIVPGSNTLNEVWSYGRDKGLHAPYHGAARALPNGNRLVNFGAAGVIHEATEDGQTAWAVSSTPAVALGSSLMVDSLYDLTE